MRQFDETDGIDPSIYYMGWGLLASLFVHVLLVLMLTPSAPGVAVIPIMVEFVPPPRPARPQQEKPPENPVAPRNQIVSPSEKSEDTLNKPLKTSLLSDRDSIVPKEQIKKGDQPDAGAVVSRAAGGERVRPRAPAFRAPLPQPAKQTSAKKSDGDTAEKPATIKQLLLEGESIDQAIKKDVGSDGPRTLDELTGNEAAGANVTGYKAFTRPPGSGAAILGTRGVSDYLPNLPDGDITLLNTKASLFAVFVRRVATQVFAALRAEGWDTLRAQDVLAIKDFSTVEAVLSPAGKLLSVEIKERSGSDSFDSVVLKAAQRGSRDPNPPKEAAASDGNIHFIFKARSWAQMGANQRTGAPIERRWLLLATGLE